MNYRENSYCDYLIKNPSLNKNRSFEGIYIAIMVYCDDYIYKIDILKKVLMYEKKE